MRLLWSLPKAAPAIFRHLVGYAELVGQDLEQTRKDLGTRLAAAVILGVAGLFVVLMVCLLVIALTWDTPYRVSAIGWMCGGFLLIAVLAAVYRAKLVGSQAPFLATVRSEWAEDRVILDKILSDQDDA